MSQATTRNRVFKKVKQKSCKLFNLAYRSGQVSDELKKLRESYEAQIEALREKIRRLDQVEKDAKPFPKYKYGSMGLTESVLDAVEELHKRGLVDQGGASVAQIRDFIAAHGMVMSNNFNVSLHVTLDRLATSKRLKLADVKGKKRYAPKDE